MPLRRLLFLALLSSLACGLNLSSPAKADLPSAVDRPLKSWQYRNAAPETRTPDETAAPDKGQAAAAPRLFGVRVDGGRLVNGNGQTVRLLGINDGRMAPGEGLPDDESKAQGGCTGWVAPTKEEIAAIAAMGFNSVRLPITWANLEPTPPILNTDGSYTHEWNQRYLAALDRTIGRYAEQGIAVILDMHQVRWSPAFKNMQVRFNQQEAATMCAGTGMPAWLLPEGNALRNAQDRVGAVCGFYANTAQGGTSISPQDGFVAAWQMLAERYRRQPNVIGADILNEPPLPSRMGCPNESPRGFILRAAKAVNAAAPHWLLIIGQNNYASLWRSNEAVFTEKPDLPNLVLSWHLYPPALKEGEAFYRTMLAQAREWNVPLWIGEFNLFGASLNKNDAPLDTWEPQAQALLARFKADGVSWAFWELRRNSSLLTPETTDAKEPLLSILRAGF